MIAQGDESPQNLYDLDSKAILRLYENWDVSLADILDESEKNTDVDWDDDDDRWDDTGRDLSFIRRLGNYQTFVENHLLNFWFEFNSKARSKLVSFVVESGTTDFDVNMLLWLLKNTAPILEDFLNVITGYSIRIHMTEDVFVFQIDPMIDDDVAIRRLSIDFPFPEMIDWKQWGPEVSEREAAEILMREFVEHPAIEAMITANQGRFVIAQDDLSLVFAVGVSHGRALAAS
jgi:hypothetical protein